MKFRMFTDAKTRQKVAVNVDQVAWIQECSQGCEIWIRYQVIVVAETYDVVLSRLNTIAE